MAFAWKAPSTLLSPLITVTNASNAFYHAMILLCISSRTVFPEPSSFQYLYAWLSVSKTIRPCNPPVTAVMAASSCSLNIYIMNLTGRSQFDAVINRVTHEELLKLWFNGLWTQFNKHIRVELKAIPRRTACHDVGTTCVTAPAAIQKNRRTCCQSSKSLTCRAGTPQR